MCGRWQRADHRCSKEGDGPEAKPVEGASSRRGPAPVPVTQSQARVCDRINVGTTRRHKGGSPWSKLWSIGTRGPDSRVFAASHACFRIDNIDSSGGVPADGRHCPGGRRQRRFGCAKGPETLGKLGGQVAERLMAPVLKTGDPSRDPWVRIPPCPQMLTRNSIVRLSLSPCREIYPISYPRTGMSFTACSVDRQHRQLFEECRLSLPGRSVG